MSLKRIAAVVLAFIMVVSFGLTICFASYGNRQIDDILAQMNANSAGWHTANDEGNQDVKEQLQAENEALAKQLETLGYTTNRDDNGCWEITGNGSVITSSSRQDGKNTEVTYENKNSNGSHTSTTVGSYSDLGLGAYLANGGTVQGAINGYNNAAFIVTSPDGENKYGTNEEEHSNSVDDEVALAKIALGLTDAEAKELWDKISEYKEDYEDATDRKEAALKELKAAKKSGNQAAIDAAQKKVDQADADRVAAHNGAEEIRNNYGYTSEPDDEVIDGGYFYTGSNPFVGGDMRPVTTFHTIKASAGEGGSINPVGDVKVPHGGSKTFVMTPDDGYEIEDVLVDGKSVGAVKTYTFTNVTKDHTITVSFKEKDEKYTITSEAGPGGSIDPEGKIPVDEGETPTFVITPDEGYEVEDVIVDGVPVGPVPEYTFPPVDEDHTITVTFKEITFKIRASSEGGGRISPSGTITVKYGGTQAFIMTPDEGYEIACVYVDGEEKGAVSQFTFKNVKRDHTIHVVFREKVEDPVISDAEIGYDTTSGDGTIKSGYGITANVTADVSPGAIEVKVTAYCEFNGRTYELEEVGGGYQFKENPDSNDRARKVYIPVETKDNTNPGYCVTFTVYATYENEDGEEYTLVSEPIDCYVLVKGSMYEDDFTGDR